MIEAALIVALANARAPRRPTGERRAAMHDALVDAASANELLGPFLDDPIGRPELPAVRAVQRAVAETVNALIGGSEPPLHTLNALASARRAIITIERRGDGTLQATLRPKRASAATTLLFAAIRELIELDPLRLRRCARPECSLVFYDVTRSATQRWHAERPCGLRERQRRHRARRPQGEQAPASRSGSERGRTAEGRD